MTFLSSPVLSLGLGKVGDKWGQPSAVSVSLVLCFVSLSFLVSFNDFFLLSLASLLIGASYPLWSLMGAVVGSMAPGTSRGRWMSVAQTVSLLATFFAPYLGGMLYDAWPYYPFVVAIVVTAMLSVLVLTKPFKKG